MIEGIETSQETLIDVKLPGHIVIVIVEDDRGHYLLTKNCLRGAGITNEIIWLEDGQTAIDFFFEQAPNNQKKYLLLLDIRLPGVDGITVLEKLKEHEILQSIPVIMLTTSEDRNDADQCYQLGCDAHVLKPPGNVLLKNIQRIKMRL